MLHLVEAQPSIAEYVGGYFVPDGSAASLNRDDLRSYLVAQATAAYLGHDISADQASQFINNLFYNNADGTTELQSLKPEHLDTYDGLQDVHMPHYYNYIIASGLAGKITSSALTDDLTRVKALDIYNNPAVWTYEGYKATIEGTRFVVKTTELGASDENESLVHPLDDENSPEHQTAIALGDRVTHWAFQREVIYDDSGAPVAVGDMEHTTYGTLGKDNEFLPVASVVDHNHPARVSLVSLVRK